MLLHMIKQFSQGKSPLWKAFLLGSIGNASNGFISAFAIHSVSDTPLKLATIAIFVFAFSAYFWVGMWRCALNTKYIFLGYALRTWLIVAAIAFYGNTSPFLSIEANRVIFQLGFLAIVLYFLLKPKPEGSPIKQHMNEVAYAGDIAYHNGFSLSDNPYPPDTDDHNFWLRGYQLAERKKNSEIK